MNADLTVDTLLARGVKRLQESVAVQGPHATPTLDAELLLSHVLGVSRTRLRSHPEAVPSASQSARYSEMLERRAAGEPIAYITGRKDFWSLSLAVTQAVLVPRPETELLVERALALRAEPFGRVADLGTGSGAVALALASERPGWQIAATDVSEASLAVARANAAALDLGRVEFLGGSWFEPLVGRTFHLIVSNPPYIADGDPALADAALTHEPRSALASGPDGMTSLREIIHSAPHYLERDGWLLLEHGSRQAEDVIRELVVGGFTHVRSHRDLAGQPRMTEAQKL